MNHHDAMTRYVSRAGFLMGIIAMSLTAWTFSTSARSQDARSLVPPAATASIAKSCRASVKHTEERS